MTDKRPLDRPGLESSKSWMGPNKQKPNPWTAIFGTHTPPAQRSVSTFSSPGSLLGKEDDAVIVELTPRYLHMGLEGESGPQCRITFGPESNRRVGDHRIWLPGYRRRQESLDSWGHGYELWRTDVGGIDLGFLSDVLERSVREAYTRHVLVDPGMSRLVLVLPSLVPHPVLEVILSTLFRRWKYPNITLLPSATMAVVAAGLRSGLVVDIGWEETVVTSIYEYREVTSHQSTRAMKMLTENVASMLKLSKDSHSESESLRFDLEFVEEVLMKATALIDMSSETEFEIEWPGGTSSYPVKIARSDLHSILLETFLGKFTDTLYDDQETPLPQLIFKSLLSLSPDLRGTCMSRIIFTGPGADSSSLRQQVLEHVGSLIETNGWTSVRGKNLKVSRTELGTSTQNQFRPPDAKHDIHIPTNKDYVEEKVQKQKAKAAQPYMQGSLREVCTLGPWAGASLLTSLRVRGFVEIERDRFMSHGLAGASRDTDISTLPQQRMSSFGLPAPTKTSERNSWTLGGWA